MRYNKSINNRFTNPASPLQDCDIATIGTIKRLWISDREYFGEHFYLSSTNQNQFGKVIGHSGDRNYWIELSIIHDNGYFTQNLTNEPAIYWNIELLYNISSQQFERRDLIESIINIKNAIYIVKDSNNKYFIIGEYGGSVHAVEANLSAESDNNLFAVTSKYIQRYPIREVDITYINEHVDPAQPLSLCDFDSWEDLCEEVETLEDLCNYTF